MEIKPPAAAELESSRAEALYQIINRLDEVGPTNTHIDRLYAISALGKKWRACYALKGTGSSSGRSVAIAGCPNSLSGHDVENWADDITSQDSFDAMEKIVTTIKGYLAI